MCMLCIRGNRLSWEFSFNSPQVSSLLLISVWPLFSSFLYTSNLISGGRDSRGGLLARHGSHFLHLEAITTSRLKMRPLYLWLSLKKPFFYGVRGASLSLSPPD